MTLGVMLKGLVLSGVWLCAIYVLHNVLVCSPMQSMSLILPRYVVLCNPHPSYSSGVWPCATHVLVQSWRMTNAVWNLELGSQVLL